MPRERAGYRENLEAILDFSGGRHLLTIGEVGQYTGLRDYRTIKSHYPFDGKCISAETFARCLAGGTNP